jgi:hypothetical protein
MTGDFTERDTDALSEHLSPLDRFRLCLLLSVGLFPSGNPRRSFAMLATTEAQAATLDRFIDAWKRWNAEEMISVFAESEDFRQVTMPFQMGMPERNRSEVQQTLPYVVRAVSNYDVS